MFDRLTRFVPVICLALAVALPAKAAPQVELAAFEKLKAGGPDAKDIAKHYTFFDPSMAEQVVVFAQSRVRTGDSSEFILHLLWNAARALDRADLDAAKKTELQRQLVDALEGINTPQYALVAKVLGHRCGLRPADGFTPTSEDVADGSALFREVNIALILSEGLRSQIGNKEAAQDFWAYQSVLRAHLAKWRPDGFTGPLAQLMPPSATAGPYFGTSTYMPGFQGDPNMSFEELMASRGPQNSVLRATLVDVLPVTAGDADFARALGEARFQFLSKVLQSQKVVLPPVTLVSTGASAPIMDWRIQNVTKSGRCNEFSDDFTTQGVDSHGFGSVCSYSGGDSTSTTTRGSIALGTQRSGFSDNSAQYWAVAGSFARGGFADRGDENQTAALRYAVTGTATLPQCTDLRLCSPVVAVDANDRGRSYSDYGQDEQPSSRTSVKVGGQLMSVGDRTLVDRSEGAVTLEINLSRDYKHVGACCYPGGGQSERGLFVSDAGDVNLGLGGGFMEWPRPATRPSSGGIGFGGGFPPPARLSWPSTGPQCRYWRSCAG